MKEETTNKKIAIFTTSEIFRSWYPKIGLPMVAEIETGDGRTAKFCSTGSIESAKESGYEVYVVTTRSSLGDHDDWWRELVDSKNVYLADARFEGEFGEVWRYEDENVDKSNSGWKRLYEHLQLPWPKNELDDLDAHWTTAREQLKNNHGYCLGSDFKTLSPRQKELLKRMKKNE